MSMRTKRIENSLHMIMMKATAHAVEACEEGQMAQRVGEWVHDLAQVGDELVLARDLSVEQVAQLGDDVAYEHHDDGHEARALPEPGRQTEADEEEGHHDEAEHSELVW